MKVGESKGFVDYDLASYDPWDSIVRYETPLGYQFVRGVVWRLDTLSAGCEGNMFAKLVFFQTPDREFFTMRFVVQKFPPDDVIDYPFRGQFEILEASLDDWDVLCRAIEATGKTVEFSREERHGENIK